MRTSFSNHVETIQAPVTDVWPRRVQGDFRPTLNIQGLCELLQIATSDDDKVSSPESPSGKGKKRTADVPTRRHRSSKRTRTSGGEADDFLWPILEYPDVEYKPLRNAQLFKNTEVVPVLQHCFEIQYTNKPAVEGDILPAWKIEEEHLVEFLAEFQSRTTEPRTIDLGDVILARYCGRLVIVSPSLKTRSSWVLLLPSFAPPIDLAWQGISSQLVEDLMMACFVLESEDRAAIQARLELVILPSGTFNIGQNELPFRLQVTANVSFRAPSIHEPFRRETKKKPSQTEDAQRRVLEFLYPSDATNPESYDGAMNIPFFYSILRPAPHLQSPSTQEAMQPSELRPTLLPFQRRSVAWLLDREGKAVTLNGEIVPKPPTTEFSFWDRIEEGNTTWYLNRLSGILLSSPPEETPVLGGILAEEPGLGKTLETIALILMNPAPPERNPTLSRWDPEAHLEVKAIKTSLIVTPPALASQWVDELSLHAPSLKVLVYDGWSKVPVPITRTQLEEAQRKMLKGKDKKSSKAKKPSEPKSKSKSREKKDEDMDIDEVQITDGDDAEIMDWGTYVNTFDVVITTYTVLRSDFNVALAVPQRPRREDVYYANVERPRSPLVMCEWNRVIMDEVQMVGGGKTEDMVSLIPRLSSFAVSGTPARAQVADLNHVLKFLRVDNIVGSTRLWNRMITTGFGAAHFAALFQKYALRTLKSDVKEELTIPQQTRYLVSISLGPVEKHVYNQAVEAVLLDLGLDARGVAGSEGWQIDGAVLRSSIRRLRGICTHPQVGQLQQPGNRLYKPGAVKTIEDVLQNMRETNWRIVMDDHKAKVQSLVRIAQLQNRDEQDENRFQHALNTLLLAEMEAMTLVEEAQSALDKHMAKVSTNKEHSRRELSDKRKGKQRELSEPLSEDEISEDDESSTSPATEEHTKKRGALQNRLRECRIALHRAKFLQGDMHHALGAAHSADEDAAYAAAEAIRRDLLKGTEEDAERAMDILDHDATRKQLTQDAFMIDVPFLDDSPIRSLMKKYQPTKTERDTKPQPHKVRLHDRAAASHKLIEEANEIIGHVLNDQSVLIWEWRTHITALLTQKLSPGEDEADGEEYQRTLDNQGEAETYLQSYSALLADRRQALLNERTLLAAHDAREQKLRNTKAAMNAVHVAEAVLQLSEDVELQPEHEVLHAQLSVKRKGLLADLEGRAIKSVLVDINASSTQIKQTQDPEKLTLQEIVGELRALMDKLDADLTLLRKAFNQRILYFRQLQEISDSVAEVTWETTVVDALLETSLEKDELDARIHRTKARQRYLEHLTKNKDDGIQDEDEESCILCRCEFARGFITHCAHIFCEGCMKAWLLRKEGKTCPVCRVPIDPGTIERFMVGQPEQEKPPQRLNNGAPIPKSRRQISYNMIDLNLFNDIKSMESFGDFGSKIQTLVRHLIYIKFTDPGAKSIVFSAWADSLHILQRALKDNGIRCLRIDQKSKGESAAKMFKNDPDILVLLLHGERENAGLNVTCASRVFLLESVVHHGFEIQAIARIDRMGQTRPTEVYCYYAEDTVERNILDLAARQGLSLYTKENSEGTINVSSLATDVEAKVVDSPRKKAQKGDFIFKMDDMLAILFPHMFEDIEYLLPPEDSMMQTATTLGFGSTEDQDSFPDRDLSDAAAGPSRLPNSSRH